MSENKLSNHEHHHHGNECCAHEAAPTEITLNPSAAGKLQTTLRVAGLDCAEEVSVIRRALKPLAGVREVRVNIMSGKTIIAHDEKIRQDLKRHAKAKNLVRIRSRGKNRD